LHIKPAETGKKKCRKPEERERTEDCRGGNSEEERQQRIKGGKAEADGSTDRPASKPSNLAVILSFPGLFPSPPAP